VSLDAYQVFRAVVEKKNFLRAAEVLHLTPSAVSYSIARLEDKFGLTLFIREKNGVRLTADGAEMLKYVKQVLTEQEKLDKTLLRLKNTKSGTVRIGTFSSACAAWIPGIVKSFSVIYPYVKIEVRQGYYRDIKQWIENGTVDMGFLPSAYCGENEMTVLSKDRIMCVVPQDFVTPNKEYVRFDDIKGLRLVSNRENFDLENDKFIRYYSLSENRQFVIEGDLYLSLLSMVENGFGISLMPRMLLDNIAYQVKVYPLVPEEYRIIGLVKSKQHTLLPTAQNMYTHIIDYLKQDCYCNS